MHSKNKFEKNKYLDLSISSQSDQFKNSELDLLKLISNQSDGLTENVLVGELIQVFCPNQMVSQLSASPTSFSGINAIDALVYQAVANWKKINSFRDYLTPFNDNDRSLGGDSYGSHATTNTQFQLLLIKAMISAVQVNIIDNDQELMKLEERWQLCGLPIEIKTLIADLMQQEINFESFFHEARHTIQKSELYLVSYICLDSSKASSIFYLEQLADVLALPEELIQELEWQIHMSVNEAA